MNDMYSREGLIGNNHRILVSLNGVESSSGMARSLRAVSSSSIEIWCTENTTGFMNAMGIRTFTLPEGGIQRALSSQQFDLVISISDRVSEEAFRNDYGLRRAAADRGIPVMTSLESSRRLCEALSEVNTDSLEIRGYDEYVSLN